MEISCFDKKNCLSRIIFGSKTRISRRRREKRKMPISVFPKAKICTQRIVFFFRHRWIKLNPFFLPDDWINSHFVFKWKILKFKRRNKIEDDRSREKRENNSRTLFVSLCPHSGTRQQSWKKKVVNYFIIILRIKGMGGKRLGVTCGNKGVSEPLHINYKDV